VFVCFELKGKLGHKGRHRSRLVVPKSAWTYGGRGPRDRWITDAGIKQIWIQNYPDVDTEAYEKVLAEAGRLFMRGRPPSEKPLALLVHTFRPIPESWSKKDKRAALTGAILPTPRPDWDNHGKITDALNEIVWKDDAQICDARVIKRYSDAPALRIEVREFLQPGCIT